MTSDGIRPAPKGDPPAARVLLAEDDPTNQYVFRAILSSAGYCVEIVENGLLAIESARAARPDLILLDMMMPVMDGYEAATRLSGDPEFDGIPIVALTAKAMKGDQERTLEAGCDDYMAKPVNRAGLIERVRLWLEQPPAGWLDRRIERRGPQARSA